MADGVSNEEPIAHSSGEHAVPSPVGAGAGEVLGAGARPHERSPHSRKFMLTTAVLVGVAAAAVVIALTVLLGGGRTVAASSAQPWSQWQPPDGGLAGEREIAAEVAPFYRASPADQLAVVTVQNIASATSSAPGATELAVRDPTTGTVAVVSGTSAVYNLCGLGSNCAITPGPPSHARLLLLQREALELALYTFRYIGGIENVVAILPPAQVTVSCKGNCTAAKDVVNKPVELAVVFTRASLARFTSRPLDETLPEQLPPTVQEMSSAPEAELVNVIASQALFEQQTVQAQDGTNVLLLSPVPPQ